MPTGIVSGHRGWSSLLRRFLDQRWLLFLLAACLMSLVARQAHLSHWRWPALLDNLVLDQSFVLRGEQEPRAVAEELPHTRNIVLVQLRHDIDRTVLALLLRKFHGARVVAIDLMFADRAADLSDYEKSMPHYQRLTAQWRSEDALLAQEIQRADNVVLGQWPEEQLKSQSTSTQAPAQSESTSSRRQLQFVWQAPSPLLWRSARYHSHFRVEPDLQDGVVRTVRLFENTPQRTPAFGLAIAAAYLGAGQPATSTEAATDFLQLNGRAIPLHSDERMLIDYVGGKQAFEYESQHIVHHRVLEMYPDSATAGAVYEDDFRGKIVIIGATNFRAKDIFTTPLGDMPGMQVHAHIVATLLSAQGPPQRISLWPTTLLALWCSVLLVLPLLRWPLAACFAFAAAEVVLLVLGAQVVFKEGHYVLLVSVPVIAIALTYNLVALYEYGRARNLIGVLTDHRTASQMLRLWSRLRLGGRLEEASAFFCDIRGYSTLSERLPPDAAMKLLNEYTDVVTDVVHKHGGRVIDYLGDGIFVLFQSSVVGENYAGKAVEAALEVQNAFAALRRRWRERGVAEVELGIAVHSGEMVVGVVGSQRRMKLGAVGDVVNVAARVQSLSPQCGFGVLLTGATYNRLNGAVRAAACGKFPVKGREQTIEVWGIGKTLVKVNDGNLDNAEGDNRLDQTLLLEPNISEQAIGLTRAAARKKSL
jgi:adenylate cyclase